MTSLFFFGTLRHRPLLDIVLDAGADLQIKDAVLGDYEVCQVKEGPFPGIRPQPGEIAAGICVQDLTPADVARLDHYEGGFGYQLIDIELADGTPAQMFIAPPNAWTLEEAWDFATWQDDWAELSCIAAREVMGYLGSKTPAQIATMFPMIRSRAWAQICAKNSLHGAGTLHGHVNVSSRRRSYAHFFALDDFELSHARFDGSMTPELDRAVFIGTDAAILLPYDPKTDCVALVEQMRMGPLARGDRSIWQLEPIAGRIDARETPEQTARREAFEEAGLTIDALHPVAQSYASPGCSSEFFYVFVGTTDLDRLGGTVGGLESEQEDIKTHVMPFDDLLALCEGLGAANAPLVLATYWLAHHRKRLRSSCAAARDK